MFGIFAWLFSALLFGVAYVFFKKWFDALNDSYAFMLNAIMGLVIWIPIALVMGVDWAIVISSGLLWFWVFWSAIISEALTLYTLSWGKISVTLTVFSLYPLFTALFSWFVNSEMLTVVQICAMVLAVVGVIMLGREGVVHERFTRDERLVLIKSIGIALLSAALVGLADSYGKFTLEQTGYATFLFCLAVAQPLVAYVNIRLRWLTLGWFGGSVRSDPHAKWFILWSLMNIVWLVFLRAAFDLLYTWVASALTSTFPVVTLIGAYFFLGERITRLQYGGIVVTLLAIFSFTAFGV